MNAGTHGHEGNSHASNSSVQPHTDNQYEMETKWRRRRTPEAAAYKRNSERDGMSLAQFLSRTQADTTTLEWYFIWCVRANDMFFFSLLFCVASLSFHQPWHKHMHNRAKCCREFASTQQILRNSSKKSDDDGGGNQRHPFYMHAVFFMARSNHWNPHALCAFFFPLCLSMEQFRMFNISKIADATIVQQSCWLIARLFGTHQFNF